VIWEPSPFKEAVTLVSEISAFSVTGEPAVPLPCKLPEVVTEAIPPPDPPLPAAASAATQVPLTTVNTCPSEPTGMVEIALEPLPTNISLKDLK